jgi:transcriptional regulator with XRE-family HTH domain
MTAIDSSPFGLGLRHWRRIRGVSQLELATSAGTTTRHLSFLETGRSRPSRGMVERLGDALSLPLRERNRLLELAGLAPSYPEGDLATEDLAPFRDVINRLLESHEPFPGFVVDRHWNMVTMNRATERFLSGTVARNTVHLLLGELRSVIENWPEVAGILLQRLSADLMRYPDDAELLALHGAVRSALGDASAPVERSADRVICPRFRIGDQVIRTITVAARFESVADVTLDEVRVELIYPEDREAERYFVELSQAP